MPERANHILQAGAGRHVPATGATLVEVLLAGALLLLVSLSFFEGVVVAGGIAKENSEYLAADAFAYDLAMCVYSQNYETDESNSGIVVTHKDISDMASSWGGTGEWQDIPETSDGQSLVPVLAKDGWPTPQYRVEVATSTRVKKGKLIQVDVQWGPAGNRQLLSNRHAVQIFRANIDRGASL